MRSVAERIAVELGAVKVPNNSVGTAREYILNNKRVALKTVAGINWNITVTYKMLERIDILLVAFEEELGTYYVYSLSKDDFKTNMSKGDDRMPPIGMMSKTKFKEKGQLLKEISL